MKKHYPLLIIIGSILLFILFMVFCPPKAPADEIHGFIQFGKDLAVDEAYAEVELRYVFDIWILESSIYGGWLTWMVLPEKGLIMQDVLYDLYTVGCRLSYEDFYVDLSHYCRHPEKLDTSDKSISTITVGVKF